MTGRTEAELQRELGAGPGFHSSLGSGPLDNRTQPLEIPQELHAPVDGPNFMHISIRVPGNLREGPDGPVGRGGPREGPTPATGTAFIRCDRTRGDVHSQNWTHLSHSGCCCCECVLGQCCLHPHRQGPEWWGHWVQGPALTASRQGRGQGIHGPPTAGGPCPGAAFVRLTKGLENLRP